MSAKERIREEIEHRLQLEAKVEDLEIDKKDIELQIRGLRTQLVTRERHWQNRLRDSGYGVPELPAAPSSEPLEGCPNVVNILVVSTWGDLRQTNVTGACSTG